MTATPPSDTTVASRPARTVDVTGKGSSEVEMFAFPTGNTRVPPGVRIRYAVVRMDGPDLVIAIGGPKEQFDAAISRTAPLLASLRIGDL
jgi:hypothetical protein